MMQVWTNMLIEIELKSYSRNTFFKSILKCPNKYIENFPHKDSYAFVYDAHT